MFNCTSRYDTYYPQNWQKTKYPVLSLCNPLHCRDDGKEEENKRFQELRLSLRGKGRIRRTTVSPRPTQAFMDMQESHVVIPGRGRSRSRGMRRAINCPSSDYHLHNPEMYVASTCTGRGRSSFEPQDINYASETMEVEPVISGDSTFSNGEETSALSSENKEQKLLESMVSDDWNNEEKENYSDFRERKSRYREINKAPRYFGFQ